jgi:hypothetical protein
MRDALLECRRRGDALRGSTVVTSVKMATSMADALGLPHGYVRLHLRHLSEAGEITFKGHGTSAAAMTPVDAANLLIAVAGSSFAKDSLETLKGFSILTVAGSAARKTDRLDHAIADEFHQIVVYLKSGPSDHWDLELDQVAVRFVSVVGGGKKSPKLAIVRSFRKFDDPTAALTFVSPGIDPETLDESDFAAQLPSSHLIQSRHVTLASMLDIGKSLVSPIPRR